MRGGAARILDSCDGDVCSVIHMRAEKLSVIHFVNVIARQNQDKVGTRVLDDRKILKYGIRRTPIPFSVYRTSADKDFVAIVAWRNS
jgi:hypothetical protein